MKKKTASILLITVSIIVAVMLFLKVVDTKILLLIYALIFAILGVLSKGFRGVK